MRRHPWFTAAIVFVALCAVLYFCVEWRAEQRWQRYAADARARGVKLLLTDFARPEIPDDQNFAALPMMRAAQASAGNPFELPPRPTSSPDVITIGDTKVPLGSALPGFGNAVRGEKIDWVEWRKYFQDVGFLTVTSDNPAGDVLRALEHYAPEFQQWGQWRTRSECRFPLDLTKGAMLSMSHLSAFQYAVKVFTLRMRAHLALGDSTAAYADFQEGLQAYHALREEPTLIAGLVRISVLAVLLAGVGDGCKDHAWTGAECQKIAANLAAIRVWDDWTLALSTDRGCMNTTLESWINTPLLERGKLLANYTRSNAEKLVVSWVPRGMVRDNQWRQNRYFDELLARIDTANQTLDPDRKTPSSPQYLTDPFDQYHYILCSVSGRVYEGVERRYVALQTLLDETRLACALERFRLARGVYPEGLLVLVPEFIDAVPTDIYARAPYRYQRVGKASFRLYSVGENRTDDGGQIVPGVPERKQPDAIWLYAPPAGP